MIIKGALTMNKETKGCDAQDVIENCPLPNGEKMGQSARIAFLEKEIERLRMENLRYFQTERRLWEVIEQLQINCKLMK